MDIDALPQKVSARLAESQTRLVLAESCTAGLVAARLAQTPGVSAWFCGSAVVYREATKQAWLGVKPETLAAHTAVSSEVAREMAAGALARTAEAHVAASVTGHLGPDAPAGFDGVIFVGIARRTNAGSPDCKATRHQLAATERIARQEEAANLVLQHVLQAIDELT
jgi:PncC family amidohydrolase